MSKVCHDLKTERSDVGQPLPGILRILPVLFFLTILFALLGNTFFYLQLNSAKAEKERWLKKEKAEKTQSDSLLAEKDTIAEEAKRADSVVRWMEGAKGMQELVLGITRSMEGDVTIAELALTRDKASPGHINTTLRLNGGGGAGGNRQLDSTLTQLNSDPYFYKSYSAQVSNGKEGQLDYEATLIRQQQKR